MFGRKKKDAQVAEAEVEDTGPVRSEPNPFLDPKADPAPGD